MIIHSSSNTYWMPALCQALLQRLLVTETTLKVPAFS